MSLPLPDYAFTEITLSEQIVTEGKHEFAARKMAFSEATRWALRIKGGFRHKMDS
jgi:hypothetical protein